MSSDDDPPESDPSPHVTAVVLAAGRGERLRSELPKPLYSICGRAMASYVLHALADAGVSRAVVVVPPDGRGRLIEQRLREDAPDLNLCFAVQQEPRGTADAVLAAKGQVRTTQVLV
ncbi:MAG: NTP transferase domain-containing protein, partial [Chloroflexi bacterium]|nr:NTP transferase domain-containing protein [Chloroflexota bacterium]